MVNKAVLIGRVGRDPELRHTQRGKAVANLSLATEESWRDDKGERQSRTEWHRLVVWGETADKFVSRYVRKGDLLYVEGRLQTSEYEKDGVKRRSTEIVVDTVRKLNWEKRSDDAPSDGEPRDIRHERQRDRDRADSDIPDEMKEMINRNMTSSGGGRLF